MTDDSAALAALVAARDAARDLSAGVADAVDDARVLCYQTAWQAPAATAFHRSVATWTGDLLDLSVLLADLEGEAAVAARRLEYRLDHALTAVAS